MLTHSWLLLLYSLTSKHGAARLSLWRHLKRIGAVPLKTSASILPDRPELYECFQWLGQRVREQGGDATLVRVAHVDGVTDEDLVALFQRARSADYQAIMKSAKTLLPRKGRRRHQAPEGLEKLHARFEAVRQIDFFECSKAADTEMLLRRLAAGGSAKSAAPTKLLPRKSYQGRRWLTRPKPEVDRVGSAWLIKKFIDEKATFVFGRDPAALPASIPYDMVDVEFGHHGEDCTFETLVKRFGITDRAVGEIAAIIHDTDLGDEKFGRVEGVGLLAVLRGWAQMGLGDDEILTRGFNCFDALHQVLSARTFHRAVAP